jgi:hypothetical protein
VSDSEANARARRVSDRHSRVDWSLELLVNLVNDGAVHEVGVTLCVGGSLVTGKLVGVQAYFEGIAGEFAKTAKGSKADELKASISRLGSGYSARTGDKLYDPEKRNDPRTWTNYVHLKDARVIGASEAPIPANRGVWWRGRLSAIDGFFLGELKPDAAG